MHKDYSDYHENKKLSERIRQKIDGWELIGEKYAGKDFNLGDETILNLFYDRTNALREELEGIPVVAKFATA